MATFTHQSKLVELFDKALLFGGSTHERIDVAEGIKSGRLHYFGDDTVAVVTEIIEYPRTRKLHVLLAAGDFNRMIDRFLPLVKRFARENGCNSITTTARKGFIRKLPKVGFRPTHIAFELKLEDN